MTSPLPQRRVKEVRGEGVWEDDIRRSRHKMQEKDSPFTPCPLPPTLGRGWTSARDDGRHSLSSPTYQRQGMDEGEDLPSFTTFQLSVPVTGSLLTCQPEVAYDG